MIYQKFKTKLSNYLRGDTGLWIAIICLLLFSFPVLYSTSGEVTTVEVHNQTTITDAHGSVIPVNTVEKHVEVQTPITKHISFILLSLILIVALQKLPPIVFHSVGQKLIYIAWILLIYTLVAGKNIGDAKRWISIFGFTIQTSEIAKIALVMYIAQYLSYFQVDRKPGRKEFIHLMVYTFVTCSLIVTENFSTALIIFAIAAFIMFIGGVPLKYFVPLIAGLVIVSMIVIGFGHSLGLSRAKTWQKRIYAHTGIDTRISGRSQEAPWLVKEEANPNRLTEANHVSLAIYGAGLFGKGYGNSKHKDYLGAASSDYIYTIIIEEGGIFIWGLILFLYLVILFRAGRIIYKSNSPFCSLLVAGCSIDIVLQAYSNMAVGSSLIPITGQTLPFVSMGGTSMLLNSAPAIGMILCVAWHNKKQRKQEVEQKQATMVENINPKPIATQ